MLKPVRQLGLLVVSIGLVLSPTAAWSNEYGASNLGGSAYLSWVFFDSPRDPIGYACFARDALFGMARTANMNRYAIVQVGNSNELRLEPLNAITVYPDGERYVAEVSEVESPDIFWENVPRDETGTWFESNIEFDEFGAACVNGGIAEGLRYLEQIYDIRINQQ
ncbi:MAG: hypothetical protein HC881_06360 [Leptolyngbyaceae cyanobacterium SL_7_1]|nr:hypothetical protein [Leptolyngbyaceae cyanobacterium SL_7_1]